MPGGETLREVQERAWAAIERMREAHPDGEVVAVTHNFVIATVVCRALDLPLPDSGGCGIGLASRTVIDMREGGATLISLNDDAHLRAAGLAGDSRGLRSTRQHPRRPRSNAKARRAMSEPEATTMVPDYLSERRRGCASSRVGALWKAGTRTPPGVLLSNALRNAGSAERYLILTRRDVPHVRRHRDGPRRGGGAVRAGESGAGFGDHSA